MKVSPLIYLTKAKTENLSITINYLKQIIFVNVTRKNGQKVWTPKSALKEEMKF